MTCGFSFKTKSSLYKHKKSHAHTIKLGLVLQPDASGLFMSHESPKALSIHSDVEDSGDSDEDGAGDERPNDPGSMDLQPAQMIRMLSSSETLQNGFHSKQPQARGGDFAPQDRSSESQAAAELPKVVVHPISMSPLELIARRSLRSQSPEAPGAQKDLPGNPGPVPPGRRPPGRQMRRPIRKATQVSPMESQSPLWAQRMPSCRGSRPLITAKSSRKTAESSQPGKHGLGYFSRSEALTKP